MMQNPILWLIWSLEMGHRVSEEMKKQYEDMIHAGLTIPSLSYYVRLIRRDQRLWSGSADAA